MAFTSMLYPAFLCVLFALYWALPGRFRAPLALAAGLGFYALFGVPMLAVLAACTLGSYALSLWLARRRTRAVLALSLAAALAPLCFYKYADAVCARFGAETAFGALVPVGMSFFTFKIVSYLAEVWRGSIAVPRLDRYALYVTFFPEVASGPIQRPGDLLCQIDGAAARRFDGERAIRGAQLALWGYFQKLVIADNLAASAQLGFTQPDLLMGGSVILAMLLYAVQLYCDFAGYSNIAVGSMMLLGYDVPDNFRSPYFSTSVRDFWSRWHISLSTFLRDYVYFPLGGSRRGTVRTCVNLLLTFLVSGLWHGTGLQFAVWGLLHGAYQVAGRLSRTARSRAWAALHLREDGRFVRAVRMLCTFVLVSAAWVFFGASSLQSALHIFARMPDSFAFSLQYLKNSAAMLGLNAALVVRYGVCLALLFYVDARTRDTGFCDWLRGRRAWVQAVFCYAVTALLLFLAPATGGGFIYFQF